MRGLFKLESLLEMGIKRDLAQQDKTNPELLT